MEFEFLLIVVVTVIIFLALFGLVIGRLYRRSTREISLVKTGAGGKKVIMDGGTIVVPLLHEVSPVNMKTLRLEVKRDGEAALITQDRMRVDVGVEFYVSVMATTEGIARAAQTLGSRTFDVEQLREMIEGKLIDGLRAVAAQMTMDGLHENRADFVQEVQNAVSEDLLKNGLSLESVSLTALDQTPFEALDENNAFNAVGMRRLAEVIATSKKERAQIDAEADVAVRRAAMEAERHKLLIEQDEEQARIEQKQKVETLRVAQEAEIAARTEDSVRETERARIAREEAIRAADIERERKIREAEISKERELEVAEQERQIIIAQKSEEESRARASADLARAEATKATEAVATARQVAEAERQKQIVLIEATREAERQATGIRLAAQAEKEAAADRAEARREEAQAEADALNIRAEAKKNDMLAEAEGKRAIVEADNVLSEAQIRFKVDLARIEAMPSIVAEMVKPAEKIDSIKIHQVGGMGVGAGGAGSVAAQAGGGDKPVVNQALDSIMGMAVQMPALKKLGEELGLSMEDGVAGITSGALGVSSEPAKETVEAEASAAEEAADVVETPLA
ncbi:flotillin domain-containing protein [Phaeobacter gallaeciensis]|uniref:flotillin family protein n=1 Tax=Phaeobacter gallaeciensis TaxID=60890 RepID=UPI00237F8FE8|nr:flotillin domain-containing protein [Phaeobacter gallaeciensis]MDE4304083.1 flotillin domain-containing protein [Phaeobacter gallaeciensis]MDE4309142.1 flotillin domain-containing protein [Phaeobacter gallaeciensis]MDE4313304.1 flotillin domain-containing protein [Phaeobacter gallaeciensis]MDE4318071.1 flotillin domain-containing protein [Phaeobacter gallaeciensis]MDE4322534.1 flotillin domain-containing protein [Phaeobacter gallaeciensis]